MKINGVIELHCANAGEIFDSQGYSIERLVLATIRHALESRGHQTSIQFECVHCAAALSEAKAESDVRQTESHESDRFQPEAFVD